MSERFLQRAPSDIDYLSDLLTCSARTRVSEETVSRAPIAVHPVRSEEGFQRLQAAADACSASAARTA